MRIKPPPAQRPAGTAAPRVEGGVATSEAPAPSTQTPDDARSRKALGSLGRDAPILPGPVATERAGRTAGHSPKGALAKLEAIGRAGGVGGVFAAIDMGSSSAKMLIARVGADGRLKTVADMKIGTSLGKDLTPGGPLPNENQERALAAVKNFLVEAAKHGIPADAVGLVTTAAVRNASNGTAFVARLKDETGIVNARILTGHEEAELGYLGAIAMFRGTQDGRFATLDLGGGSFQLAVGTSTSMEAGASTQVGSNHVLEQLLPKGVVLDADFAKADARLVEMAPLPLDPTMMKGRTLVAVGGVSKFLRAHFGRDVITRDDVDALRRQMGALPYDKRGPIVQGTKDESTRVALGVETEKGAYEYGAKLPASTTLLLRIMDGIGVTSIRVSETDARHVVIARQQREAE